MAAESVPDRQYALATYGALGFAVRYVLELSMQRHDGGQCHRCPASRGPGRRRGSRGGGRRRKGSPAPKSHWPRWRGSAVHSSSQLARTPRGGSRSGGIDEVPASTALTKKPLPVGSMRTCSCWQSSPSHSTKPNSIGCCVPRRTASSASTSPVIRKLAPCSRLIHSNAASAAGYSSTGTSWATVAMGPPITD